MIPSLSIGPTPPRTLSKPSLVLVRQANVVVGAGAIAADAKGADYASFKQWLAEGAKAELPDGVS